MSRWRAAERQLAAVDPDTHEGRELEEEIERLRGLYQDLFRR